MLTCGLLQLRLYCESELMKCNPELFIDEKLLENQVIRDNVIKILKNYISEKISKKGFIYVIEFNEIQMMTFGDLELNPIKITLSNNTTIYLSSIMLLNNLLQKILKINYIFNYKKHVFISNKFVLNIVYPFDINDIFNK